MSSVLAAKLATRTRQVYTRAALATILISCTITGVLIATGYGHVGLGMFVAIPFLVGMFAMKRAIASPTRTKATRATIQGFTVGWFFSTATYLPWLTITFFPPTAVALVIIALAAIVIAMVGILVVHLCATGNM